jgi:glutathione S-transferase
MWPDDVPPPGGRAPGDSRARTLEWLHGRIGDLHPELAAAIRRCVREGPDPDAGSGVAEVLADAASAALERVAHGPQDRAAAVRLLAADAVLTYAFEAAATEGGDPGDLADRVGLRGTLGRALLDAIRAEGETP